MNDPDTRRTLLLHPDDVTVIKNGGIIVGYLWSPKEGTTVASATETTKRA